MPYIVHNLTKKTIILSDIRAEIRPRMTMDLERFAHRQDIERSFDLIQSIKSGKLRIVGHSALKSTPSSLPLQSPRIMQVTERVIEKPSSALTKEQLEDVVRKVISENKGVASNTDLQKIIQEAIGTGLAHLTGILKGPETESQHEHLIDPEKLAGMQQHSINKVFEEMQTGTGREKSVVETQNNNIDDLAKELLD